MRATLLPVLGTFLLAPVLAWAQNEVIVVTAAPPEPLGNAAFSVMRLDESALSNKTQLDAALRQVPGLSLFRRDSSINANPGTQGVSLRSIAPSGAGRALVTLDGVPQNDPFGGWVIWTALPAEDIGSASVVRGAGSGPYGAGALTGVVALSEKHGEGLVAADLSAGSLGLKRAAAAGGVDLGQLHLFASASGTKSDGWIPVGPTQRGAADSYLTLEARNVSLRAEIIPEDGTLISLRFAAYDEYRDSGVVGATSTANGQSLSLTMAHPETEDSLGWRLQGWYRHSDFTQTSSSVTAGRSIATPSNNQYATPANGWGVNAALRGAFDRLEWEVGADARGATGESQEQVAFIGGRYTVGRVAGGRNFVGGLYVETASRFDGWLFTAGLRADQWASTGGHLIQKSLVTGATTLNTAYASRSGIVPTARLGARYELDDGLYMRSAAYAGFRAPTLNELYRPFRLGANVTVGNERLAPEKLYGVEIGAGAKFGDLKVDGTLFFNQLHGGIANVTEVCVVALPITPVSGCPLTVGPGPIPGYPSAGSVSAGGLVIQKQNAGNVNAFGFEAEASYPVADHLFLNAAFAIVNAQVDGRAIAPQLTGKRPSQAPRWTVTGGVQYWPIEKVMLSANIRYESDRYSDDLNTLLLPAAASVDVRASLQLSGNLSLYIASDNVFNTRIASSKGADGIINYSAPRLVRAGLSFSN